jgi:hypothetical protein
MGRTTHLSEVDPIIDKVGFKAIKDANIAWPFINRFSLLK